MRIGIVSVRDAAYHPNRRLIEAAQQRGHDAWLLDPYALRPLMRGGQLVFGPNTEGPRPDVVIPRQGALVSDPNLAYVRQLELAGVALLNRSQPIAIARDKFHTMQCLTAAGLPVPDSILCNHRDTLAACVASVGAFPLVVKQTRSRQGSGVWLAESLHELEALVDRNLQPKQGVLLQRFVPTQGRRDIRVLVLGGDAVAAMEVVAAPGDFRSNIHRGGRGEGVPVAADLRGLAERAALCIGLDLAGVDLLVDRHGSPYLLEVNYAPGFRGLEQATGLDVAAMIVRHLETEDSP